MKSHKRLMHALAVIAKQPLPNQVRSKTWQMAHPITAGLIPVTNYIPPSGKGARVTI